MIIEKNTLDTAALLGISQRAVLSLIQRKKLPARNVGSKEHPRWLVPLTAINNRLRASHASEL